MKRFLLGLFLVVGIAGGAVAEEYENPRDPWEGYNRGMFAINEALDTVIAKPIAQVYEFIIPEPIRILVTNVFSNLSDVVIGINDLLQGR
ncbi:MAG: MlaA family lipoprotein, partial [Fluviibacter sp.]